MTDRSSRWPSPEFPLFSTGNGKNYRVSRETRVRLPFTPCGSVQGVNG
jgi:hypothetical protein